MSTAIVRRAGIAATAVLALALLTPIAVTAAGAFSRAEWYGRRSEGDEVQSVPDLFRYVVGIWGGALLRSVEIVAAVVPLKTMSVMVRDVSVPYSMTVGATSGNRPRQ